MTRKLAPQKTTGALDHSRAPAPAPAPGRTGHQRRPARKTRRRRGVLQPPAAAAEGAAGAAAAVAAEVAVAAAAAVVAVPPVRSPRRSQRGSRATVHSNVTCLVTAPLLRLVCQRASEAERARARPSEPASSQPASCPASHWVQWLEWRAASQPASQPATATHPASQPARQALAGRKGSHTLITYTLASQLARELGRVGRAGGWPDTTIHVASYSS